MGIIQLAYHGSDRCHDSRHRECEAVNPASSVVAVPNVVHSRVSNRASLLGAVELGTVVSDERVIAFAAGVGKQEAVLLALPPQVLNMIYLMLAKEPTKGFDELNRNVFIEQKLHLEIKS
jgi:hypothetical protein